MKSVPESSSESSIASQSFGQKKQWIGFGLLTSFTGILGFFWIMGQFQPYDDEGYLMLLVEHHLAGRLLYRDISTLYGPAYFLLKIIIHGWLGIPLCHDLVRLQTLLEMVLAALLCGLSVHRIVESLAASLATQLTVFYHLFYLIKEPGHPNSQIAVMLSLSVYLITFIRGEGNNRLPAILLGATAGLLLLCKVNIGIFFIAGIGAGATLNLFSRRLSTTVRLLVILAGVTLPFILMHRHLHYSWARQYATLNSMSVLAMFLSMTGRQKAPLTPKAVALMLSGMAAVGAIVMGLMNVEGVGPANVLDQVFVIPLQFAGKHWEATPAGLWSPVIAVLMVCLVVGFRRFESAGLRTVANLLGTVFLLISLACVWSDNRAFLFLTGAPFLCLLPILMDDREDCPALSMVALVALFQHLQCYPVSGTQMNVATFLFIPLAMMMCLRATTCIGWLSVHRNKLQRAGLAGCSILMFALTLHAGNRYRSYSPLRLPGSSLLRLPDQDCAALEFISVNLRASADTFYSMPGMNSFYFWTNLPNPTRHNIDSWMLFLGSESQKEIVDSMTLFEKPAIVKNDILIEFWTMGHLKWRDTTFLDWMQRNFRTVLQLGHYEMLLQKGQKTNPVHRGHLRISDEGTDVSLFLLNREDARRMRIFDWREHQILDEIELTGRGPEGQSRLYSGRASHLKSIRPYFLTGRVYDAAGRQIATIPLTSTLATKD